MSDKKNRDTNSNKRVLNRRNVPLGGTSLVAASAMAADNSSQVARAQEDAMCQLRHGTVSFDHLVGENEQIVRYGEAKRFSGFEVDGKIELCWLDREEAHEAAGIHYADR